MTAKTRITRNGTIHYLECVTCGKEKTNRHSRQRKLCRPCSSLNRRSKDIADDLRQCIKCEMVYPRDLEHFYSKGYRLDGTQRLDTTCKACDDKRKQEWNKNNRDKKNASTRRSYKKNATKIKLRQKEKRKNDPSLRQYFRQYYQDKLKNDPHHRVRRNVSKSVWEALSGKKKSKPTFEALGYTKEDLVEHLESQFDENMTWDNYGSYWHIDHIYPQSRLPYDSMEHPNFLKCWDLSNLRPLEAIENMSKGNKIINS